MAYRTRNRTILAKIETTAGTDAAPVVGTDAVRVENPVWQGGIESVDTDEVRSGLDRSLPIAGGGPASWSAGVNVKGSGTAGTEPEWGVFMRGAGFAVNTIAADVSGTAVAGAASTITLASGQGASVTVGAVINLTGGTGSGQTRVIKSIAGDVATVTPAWTTIPATTSPPTTTYTVFACNVYVPASASLKTLTLYDYLHNSDSAVNSKLRKVLGAQATASFTLPVRGVVRGEFQFTGVFSKPTDVAKPAAETLDSQRPTVLQAADSFLGGVAAKFSQLTVDVGNTVVQPDDPTATYGFDVADITDRAIAGRINPLVALISARDTWSDFLAGTARDLWVRYGGTAGNRVSFLLPDVRYTGSEIEDVNAIAHEGIPFASRTVDGGLYLAVY